ncbi:MAG TPA: FHA domain-containing protein, partial [Candidatus Binataceae bacterium]|nr:FHA domain-containing protein [Candidatus Binataceae bacterium]
MPAKNGAGDRLVALGSAPAREYSLDKPTIAIGSHPKNDVVADHRTVSRRHATITRKADGFELADLGSTNGTFVNRRRLTEPVVLKPGDEIKFGSVRFAFNPQLAPRRMWVGLLITTLALVAGFVFARRNPAMRPALSALFGESSSPELSPAPAVMNTQSPASINTQSAGENEGSTAGSAAAAPPSPATALSAVPEWLRRVNYYRQMVKLPPIFEDPAASQGDRAHTTYIVRNYHDRIEHNGLGAEMHTEDPGSPNFTPEGLEAAKSSDMDVWSMRGVSAGDAWGSPTWSIDGWIAIPFHRMPILNPRLTSAGFGMHCEAGACAAGLNLLKGSQGKMSAQAAQALPIEFPPDGATVALTSFNNEWPDPRTSCPGYAPPSGLAITLQLGDW